MVDKVEVTRLPKCDFCDDGSDASFDAKTIFGSWANMCENHFFEYGFGRLGTGYGQRLVLTEPVKLVSAN